MTLLEYLVKNDSIKVKQKAETWEDAVRITFRPLLEKGVIKEEYIDSVIERTHELGPYYILAPGLAMPHERPEKGVLKDGFSFITLEKPVVFPDGQDVDILLGFSATSSEVHSNESIPQIVMLFDDEAIFEKIRKAVSTDESIGLLK